jgi:hypothetical protein
VKIANERSSILCGFGIPESVVFFLIDEVKCTECKNKQRGGVCHTVALPFTLKSVLRPKKKNYENSNIFSPCKYIFFIKKIL